MLLIPVIYHDFSIELPITYSDFQVDVNHTDVETASVKETPRHWMKVCSIYHLVTINVVYSTTITTYNYIKFCRSLKYDSSYIVLPLYHVGSMKTLRCLKILKRIISACGKKNQTLQADSQVVWLVFLIGCLQRKHYIPDSAISLLLQIIYIFLKVLSKLNPSISDVVKCFPSTLHKMHNLLGLKSISFTKVCHMPKM